MPLARVSVLRLCASWLYPLGGHAGRCRWDPESMRLAGGVAGLVPPWGGYPPGGAQRVSILGEQPCQGGVPKRSLAEKPCSQGRLASVETSL